MASFFNLTLDTIAPAGLTLKINDGALYTTSASVSLAIGIGDASTSGYQMKVWGTAAAAAEEDASWESFSNAKTVALTAGDGLKTVYVKVRDDVGNETAVVSDTITLDTAVPAVSITGPDKSKISKVAGFNQSVFNFTCDVDFDEYKVCVVPATNSTQDAGKVIGTANGSVNTSGNAGGYPASTNIAVTITGADLAAVSADDGVKIIKVFVRNAAGTWSVA